MGYKRSALLLEWPEESEFSGLEVRMKRLSLRQLLKVESLSDLRASGNAKEIIEAWAEMLDIVGKGLLGWNLDDDNDVAVPADRESLDDADPDMILALIRAWTRAAAAVPLASPPTSPTGEPAPPDEEWAAFLANSQEVSPPASPEHVSS